MCLFTYREKPFVASDDIVTYKWLRPKHTFFSRLFGTIKKLKSPVMNFEYKLGKTYSTTFKESEVKQRLYRKFEGKMISKGFHSNASRNNFNYSHPTGVNPTVLVKCIIPKGTRYYTSESDIPTSDIEIVSECIILKEIVNFD